MKIMTGSLFLALIFFFGRTGYGDDIKIAVVDMDKTFQAYYKTKLADANLKKQAEVFKAYAEKLNESRIKLQEEFKELRDSSQNIAYTEAERENKRLAAQEKYRQFKTKETEYQQYNQEKQKQLREEFEKKRKEILEEIKSQVYKFSILEGYTIVLDASGKTLNDLPSLIYFKPSLDITQKVIKELNRSHESQTVNE